MRIFNVRKHQIKANHLLLSVVLLIAFFFTACSTQPQQSASEYTITTTAPDRIRFHGKGAGAGMMLMSSMGSTGIAIGIAIDEGISKDIDARAKAGQINIENIVIDELHRVKKATNKQIANHLNITIERYGFVTSPQNNDHVIPQLHLTIHSGKNTQIFKYPEDDKTIAAIAPTAHLNEVKTNSKTIDSLLRNAASFLAQKIVMGSK